MEDVMITFSKLALLLILAIPLLGQVTYSVLIPSRPPGGVGGSCSSPTIAYLNPTGGGNSQIVTCIGNVWTVGGGGGGGSPAGSVGDIQYKAGSSTFGAPANSVQLGDLTVVRTSATRLTIGGNCSATYPCNFVYGSAFNCNCIWNMVGPATLDIAPGFGAGTDALIYLGPDGNLHVVARGTVSDISKITCTPTAPTTCDIAPAGQEWAATVSLTDWNSTVDGVWDATASPATTYINGGRAWAFANGGGIVILNNTDDGPNVITKTWSGSSLNLQSGSNITWTIGQDANGYSAEAQPNVSLTPIFNTVTTGNFVNPLLFTKNTQSATAPGAGFANLRWVAGTNMGTCKLVSNAGTSATEVTIIDNVGSGC